MYLLDTTLPRCHALSPVGQLNAAELCLAQWPAVADEVGTCGDKERTGMSGSQALLPHQAASHVLSSPAKKSKQMGTFPPALYSCFCIVLLHSLGLWC